MTDRPPLVPADIDLAGFDGMMIDIPRLRKSQFDAMDDDTAWRAGINLWFSAWEQVPAGSLEDSDATLRRAAGLGRDQTTWERVREAALRSWVRCSDGRLYHPTVCETALGAWLERLAARRQGGAGNAERWGIEFAPEALLAQIHDALDALEGLNPKSDVLRKYRRRYKKQEVRTDTPGNPNGHDEPSERTKTIRTDGKTVAGGSQADGDAEGEDKKHSPPTTEPRSREAAFEWWRERIPKVLAECPKIDSTSTGIVNLAALIALEAEGLDPELDIIPAIYAVAHGWSGKRRIFSWKLDAFIDTAHGNKMFRDNGGKQNGQANRPRTRGRGPSGFSEARVRDRAGGKSRAEHHREEVRRFSEEFYSLPGEGEAGDPEPTEAGAGKRAP